MKASRREAIAFLRRNYLKFLSAIAAVIIISLLFGVSVNAIVGIALLVVAASFSTFYFNYVAVPVNFELVKLATIMVAYTHGIPAGLAVGILSTIFGKVLIGRIDDKLPISIAAISIVAVLAALFSSAEITTLGIMLVGLYNVIMFSISMALGGDFGWNLPYEGTNFAINFILFTRIAPLLLPLVQ